MKYPIAIETGNADIAWGVVVPDLPGCFSAGDTLDEAYNMAKEAIEAWINMALDAGQDIPAPSDLARHMGDPEYVGWSWGIVDVDMSAFEDTVERINISIPRRILRQIDRYAESRHMTRSSFLAESALKVAHEPDHVTAK
jgi:predicted RNase H-like HicB family nuclease